MKALLPLRLALTANAAFSFSTALLMLFCPVLVGTWLGIQTPNIFQVVGIGLAIFATELIYQARCQRVATWRALLASAADFSWVVGSVVLLLAFPQVFSPLGNVLVLAVAGAVFVFGSWQLWAAGHAHKTGAGGDYRHCIIVETNAPAQKLWEIIGNIGEIENYMPSLKHSFVLEGKAPSVGAIRVCENRAGQQWSEECTEFSPGRSFAVRFLSEAANFPFPAKTMRGGWEVIPSGVGSQVMVWWELKPKSKLLAPIILPLLAFQVDRDFPQIVRRMAATAILEPNGNLTMRSKDAVFARLLPIFC
ncbi:SRPBCC family protein [Chamaesiphon sp. VAR_48_metabat_135_sub]|uniref:SRPBCC family protein n=1 Tax=Chamaesiphon sp. VAR_48_metabat_135_sub TaxID=2964699 RepID=UPI00286D1341|nr:SRPBCC family protein [Chamaesiphon sp. VAR_48_metabat_135_sub]